MDKGKGIIGEPASKSLHSQGSVVQDPIVVNISRKVMLRQIVSQLGATIRTEELYKLDERK
ncbi:unnamed protein product, partial [Urochloa humidicola]